MSESREICLAEPLCQIGRASTGIASQVGRAPTGIASQVGPL